VFADSFLDTHTAFGFGALEAGRSKGLFLKSKQSLQNLFLHDKEENEEGSKKTT
jgi:hypothetical protein